MDEVVDDGWGRHRADDEVNNFHLFSFHLNKQSTHISIYKKIQDHTDEPMENPQEVISECLSKFCTPDYIMEPGIFTQLKRYIDILTKTK